VHQDFHGIHLRSFVGLSNPHISKTTNFIFSQNSPPSHICRRAPPTLAMCKTRRTQNFRAPRVSWYSFADICRPFQPSHLKNHEFLFFTKHPTKPSSYSWCTDNLAMCKPLRTQNFRAPRISWYSFGDICSPFQPSHLKNHEFHFFTKLLTNQSSYAVVHRQACHVQNPPNSKLACTKNFMVFIWGHL